MLAGCQAFTSFSQLDGFLKSRSLFHTHGSVLMILVGLDTHSSKHVGIQESVVIVCLQNWKTKK
jgi:hypothetical protein